MAIPGSRRDHVARAQRRSADGAPNQDQIVRTHELSRLAGQLPSEAAGFGPWARRRALNACLVASSIVASATLVGGCTSYERQPLDIGETRQALLTRSANDESVRALADALTQREGRTSPYEVADGLSLDEAEAFALVYNPALRVARLEAGVAKAGAEHAALWDDPTLGADFERILSETGGASRWVQGVNVGLTIPVSGRLSAARDRANAESAAAWDRVAAQEWDARTHLRETWIEWSAARLQVEVAASMVERVRVVNEIAQKQEAAGSMSRIEARLLRSDLASREVALVLAKSHAVVLEHEVRAIMGLHALAPVELVPTVAVRNEWRAESDLLEVLGERNLDLATSRASYEVAEHTLREEIRKQYPDITLSPGFGSDQGDDRVSLGISLALPIWNRNQRGVAEAIAARDAARARFDATYEGLASKLSLAQASLHSAAAVRQLVESSVVPLAEEQESDIRRVAELGRLEPLMLLASLQSLHEARVRAIEARATESIAMVQIDALLGPVNRPAPSIEVQSTSPTDRRKMP